MRGAITSLKMVGGDSAEEGAGGRRKRARQEGAREVETIRLALEASWAGSRQAPPRLPSVTKDTPADNDMAGQEDDADDDDVLPLVTSHPRRHYIIPPNQARPLVLSSLLLLLQSMAAFGVCLGGAPPLTYPLPPLLFATYITSTNFWSAPTIRSPWRYADYIMVALSILYGTFVIRLATPASVFAFWCRGWTAVGAIFVTNEVKFWATKARRGLCRRDYAVAVWVHLAAVHVGGNAIVACALAALARGGM